MSGPNSQDGPNSNGSPSAAPGEPETPPLEDILQGRIPPWIRKILKQCGRGINHHRMIRDGDRILLGVSGGKDSLALAFCLALRRRWLPITYTLEALQIDWKEYPLSDSQKNQLTQFFGALEIPLTFQPVTMLSESFHRPFSCYLCSRNRKRVLFDEAGRRGISRIALGHHRDDIILTTLMNMIYRGNLATMMPVQEFFGGRIHLLRPLCEVSEAPLQRLARRLDFPVASIGCPYKETNLRDQMGPLMAELERLNPRVRDNLYRAPFHIDSDYLPGGRKPENPQ